jgi:hypothetical protein
MSKTKKPSPVRREGIADNKDVRRQHVGVTGQPELRHSLIVFHSLGFNELCRHKTGGKLARGLKVLKNEIIVSFAVVAMTKMLLH